MQIKAEYVEIEVAGKMMRTLVTQPVAEGKYPGIVYFSDIFQLSDPMLRTSARLAGYGFVVAAHEIFHRLEPAGVVLQQTVPLFDPAMGNADGTGRTQFTNKTIPLSRISPISLKLLACLGMSWK